MRLLFCLIVLAFLYSCNTRGVKERTVSVSILPQRYFVERIAGDRVKVNVMVPPGANPASMDLSTGQLQALYNSSLYFAVGYLPFETSSLYPLLERENSPRLIRLSDGMQLETNTCHHGESGYLHEESAHFDPHVWMSPAYARQMAQKIYEVLGERFPEDAPYFTDNYRQFTREIDSIDRAAREITGRKHHRTFLIYHPALTYFARDYGMRQISIEDEGKEPNPAHVKALIDTCRREGIRLVFIQNQFDQANATTIAQEIGGEVIPIDPLAENWKEEMKRLLDIINRKME